MKKCGLLLLSVFLFGYLTAQTERVEIPITLHDGLGKGMGEHAMNGLSFVDWETYTWKELIPKPKGLPDDWTKTRFGVEFLNQPQFIYQHTKSGQLPEGFMQEAWLENAQFTETPIRCSIRRSRYALTCGYVCSAFQAVFAFCRREEAVCYRSE